MSFRKFIFFRIVILLVIFFNLYVLSFKVIGKIPSQDTFNFKTSLPLIIKTIPYQQRTVNIPFFGNDDVTTHYDELSIFWFGNISPKDNYADVRIGYNNTNIELLISIFDRRLWYDPTPSVSDLHNWDAVSIYISTDNQIKTNLSSFEFRFTGQLTNWETNRTAWQNLQQGSLSGWKGILSPFSTDTGYRWENATDGGVNNDKNNRGWFIRFKIPFSSLGIQNTPPEGTNWRLAIELYDRDDISISSFSIQSWPEKLKTMDPSTWGILHFGIPVFQGPSGQPTNTTYIQNKLNGAYVPDAAVGGTTGNLCPGDTDYIWNEWGNENYGRSYDFNIQNQSDLADWPCFSKYFITFPLGQIPPGKIIHSATLTLYHWGNSGALSGSNQGRRSFIHVFTVTEDWNENQITWNNAPLAFENISRNWVDMAPEQIIWPGIERNWDVSKAVIEAYEKKMPLRLALYSSDSSYHSGKFFTSSDAPDWNAAGRPKLTVHWSNP